MIAVSVGERLSYDDRVDNAARIIMTPSLILVWSFADPIHPQVLWLYSVTYPLYSCSLSCFLYEELQIDSFVVLISIVTL